MQYIRSCPWPRPTKFKSEQRNMEGIGILFVFCIGGWGMANEIDLDVCLQCRTPVEGFFVCSRQHGLSRLITSNCSVTRLETTPAMMVVNVDFKMTDNSFLKLGRTNMTCSHFQGAAEINGNRCVSVGKKSLRNQQQYHLHHQYNHQEQSTSTSRPVQIRKFIYFF